MTKKPDYYNRSIEALKHLKREYPTSTLGKHLEIAFSDYLNLFSVTDREMSHALDKYIAELDMNTVSDSEIERIVQDTEQMFQQLESETDRYDEEEDEENY